MTTRDKLTFGVLVVAALGLIFHRQVGDLFRPAPVVIELAELERQFDADTPAALAHWRKRPMLLSATIATGQGDSVALETIYVMAVHAEVNSPINGHDGERITLHCRDVKESGLIGGKPGLLNCDIASLGR